MPEEMTQGKGIVCLTFDNMGSAYEVGQRTRGFQDPDDNALSIGYPKVLALLEKLGLKASFFIEGWNAIHNTSLVQELVNRGHEIGLHGWVHEVFHSLEQVDAERVMLDSVAAFRAIGVHPQGFRAPGGERGEFTVDLLKRLNVRYDSSVDADAAETLPSMLEGGIVNVPWLWSLIDYYHYFMRPESDRSPEAYEELLMTTLRQTAETGGMMTPIFHAHVSGVDDARLSVIERFLTSAMAHENISILTADQVARKVRPISSSENPIVTA